MHICDDDDNCEYVSLYIFFLEMRCEVVDMVLVVEMIMMIDVGHMIKEQQQHLPINQLGLH